MKVTKIHIKDFHQFKDFEVDLTYPKGHIKEGMPLDKVCFIGQCGTGKTKLLDFISGHTHNKNSFLLKYSPVSNKKNYVSIQNFSLRYNQWVEVTNRNDIKIINYKAESVKNNGVSIQSERFNKLDDEYILNVKPNLICYPAELKYEMDDSVATVDFKERAVLDFSIEKASAIWTLILTEIQEFQEKELAIRQELSRVVEDNKNDLEAIRIALKALEDWQKSSFNPIVDISEKCLNPILSRFNLRVKTKLDIQKKDDIGFIKIEDLNGNEIPYGLWSTGTKQVVLSALPLYLLKPEHTIIVFDEPERSLYPDIQKEIIDYYLSLTKECQLFFSTHSPIIASSFEPWEIIELKFDKEGHVYQEKYYEGERHIDNYTINPNYLTYDLILSKVFDLKETYPAIRDEKITEVLMLRNQLNKLKKENKLTEAQGKELYQRYIKLAKQLSWEFEIPTYEEA